MATALRAVVFSPYRKGKGPTFRLSTFDTGRRDGRGQTIISYRLQECGAGFERKTLFLGEDFAGSPLHADDSDETMRSLMTFLTLRPGDTDAEYFANYTDSQRAFCEAHAEALSAEVEARFGDRS